MVLVGNDFLNLRKFEEIVLAYNKIDLDTTALSACDDSFRLINKLSATQIIYGVNTGFGPMAQFKVQDKKALQLNLIRSHCSGMGKELSTLETRALMLARLNSLLQGKSGVHESVLKTLQLFINNKISPTVFEHGGVGASGDLVQLAHLALNLIGEGEVIFDDKKQPAKAVFDQFKASPVQIQIREGLAMMNGTSAMTGLAALNVIQAKKLFKYTLAMGVWLNELVGAFDDAFSEVLNQTKHHLGQQKVAQQMRKLIATSQCFKKRYHNTSEETADDPTYSFKVQEFYSLRCLPQILGPILETIEQCEKTVESELNSANDNPIIDTKTETIYHGGNFHGDYISLEMDKLKMVMTKLSVLLERQLNFLLNPTLNNQFPNFLNAHTLGLNFGLQGIQFTATSTVAENKTLSFPQYVNSIPCNNDNQDVVSMGFNSAKITQKVIENCTQVVSIQLLALSQATAISNKEENQFATSSQVLKKQVEAFFTLPVTDQPHHNNLKVLNSFIQHNDITNL